MSSAGAGRDELHEIMSEKVLLLPILGRVGVLEFKKYLEIITGNRNCFIWQALGGDFLFLLSLPMSSLLPLSLSHLSRPSLLPASFPSFLLSFFFIPNFNVYNTYMIKLRRASKNI